MSNSIQIPAALSLDGLGGLDARAGFAVAGEAGYRGVAFGTNHSELNPDQLGETARRHVRTILAGKGLDIASIRAAVPRGGMADMATVDKALESARKAILLARELGVGTVSLNVGNLEGDAKSRVPEGSLVAALRELAQQADAAGLVLALGADQAEMLARVLKQVDFEGARMNLEGARVIGAGEDVEKVAEDFGGSVGQFTAADAVRVGGGKGGGRVRAEMLGEGQLPLKEVMAMLEERGFRGPTVVDVRNLPDGAGGARHAADVLRRLWAK